MGFGRVCLTHPHPNPPLEGEGVNTGRQFEIKRLLAGT
ncbi:MAG: hypothetical protein AzoDbin1_02897 [Azoarcus sp.]|uniref:Uncharacterized protein n=1 Tax=Aromatoleum tolulyticum TaxID=34027 RepID=A0A1N7ARP9_9RHOO|nr:hypothetical protein [Azoarcus sp.]SIR41701.1 hypothetical protein SAMN05421829_1157 [Aromatoleum tolulyticum]